MFYNNKQCFMPLQNTKQDKKAGQAAEFCFSIQSHCIWFQLLLPSNT